MHINVLAVCYVSTETSVKQTTGSEYTFERAPSSCPHGLCPGGFGIRHSYVSSEFVGLFS
jgi:hypothetical protein